jgi:hypothetical protein
MYSGEYDACDVTLQVYYPHRASLKNMPDHGGIRTYDLCHTQNKSGISTHPCIILYIINVYIYIYIVFIERLRLKIFILSIYVSVFFSLQKVANFFPN